MIVRRKPLRRKIGPWLHEHALPWPWRRVVVLRHCWWRVLKQFPHSRDWSGDDVTTGAYCRECLHDVAYHDPTVGKCNFLHVVSVADQVVRECYCTAFVPLDRRSKWTRELPTEAGWYWNVGPSFPLEVEQVVIDNGRACYAPRDWGPMPIRPGDWWLRIEEPPEVPDDRPT